MVEKYSAVKRIPSFDVDMSGTLRPTSFLNFAQEAANIHADYIGVGYDSMHVTRKAWVLSKMHVIFHRLPKWREHINIQTSPLYTCRNVGNIGRLHPLGGAQICALGVNACCRSCSLL